jgi:hypothetical protein
MFPLMNNENVLYCRDDLSDLREVVDELLINDRLRHRIATQGKADYLTWARGWGRLLSAGFDRHLHDFLGTSTQVPRASV